MTTILIVDDHPTNRQLLVTLLSYRDYHLLEASDGAEGLALVRAEQPDLIIADILMPTMDGYEFARRVRADSALAQTQIIFYTATYLEAEARELAWACGVQYLITKPADPQDILDTVDAALQSPPPQTPPIAPAEFNRDHRELLTSKLAQKVDELEAKNEELAGMTQQLWQAAKLATMGELAASVAHELNNPLAIISLRIEILLAQLAENDPRQAALQVIEGEVERMGRLVADLLQFSRRSQPQVSTVDIREEVGNALQFVHYHLRNRQIQIVQEFGTVPLLIQADRQQLRQMFLNLLTNASDAMPDGGTLSVRIFAGRLNDEAAAVIEFIDTGLGIPPDDIDRIWESFFTTKPEGKGTGLGLAICRRVAHEHGGSIDIFSQPDQGTRVQIRLPVKTNQKNNLTEEADL